MMKIFYVLIVNIFTITISSGWLLVISSGFGGNRVNFHMGLEMDYISLTSTYCSSKSMIEKI